MGKITTRGERMVARWASAGRTVALTSRGRLLERPHPRTAFHTVAPRATRMQAHEYATRRLRGHVT